MWQILQLNTGTFQTTGIKRLFSTVNHQNGLQLKQVFPRLSFYINDLPKRLRCNAKLFPGDTSLYLNNHQFCNTSSNLNEDLLKLTHWAYQWKLPFNSDITKQAQEIIFFSKKKMMEVIQVYTLIMHKYNSNPFKNILISFQMKSSRFWNILM